ncbi:succinate dehydrogenase iron-sulfur subunit [Thiomicrorhabdus chilensis]|uniref:succinate dehydrogenase iron-sulfur subunit n=1 Tax=Thiomicrorhabdus chilensis TaxID=63656 RepID=UPI0004045573|nr:succinate dehydrogenase iron-sulfur subunit [Thiomicrorhabdus chilensis]
MEFIISRYNPETDSEPYDQHYHLPDAEITADMMLLNALQKIRELDPGLSFRSSCQEGVCGSDGMNVNGQNHLSCITPLSSLSTPVKIKPLPGLPIIKDLIIDMSLFYQHYKEIDPFLQATSLNPDREHLQTPQQRSELDGSYECILCGCCSTSCPSFWWNPDQFLGPAALLAAQRFVVDSRDIMPIERLKSLDDPMKTFRCRHIQNCTAACPKGLNPSRAIQSLKARILSHD